MTRLVHLFAASLVVLAAVAPAAAAERETLDDVLGSLRTDDIKAVGLMMLVFGYPDEPVDGKEELRRNWWAFKPDLKLPKEQLDAARDEFDLLTATLRIAVRDHGVRDLKLVGVDKLGVVSHQDWYYLAPTPEGPVLFRVSVAYAADGPRIHGIKWFTKWDDVKAVLAKVEHKAGKAVLSIAYVPVKDRPKPPDRKPPTAEP